MIEKLKMDTCGYFPILKKDDWGCFPIIIFENHMRVLSASVHSAKKIFAQAPGRSG